MSFQSGDMVTIWGGSHGYPRDWSRGDQPTKFPDHTTAIFLEEFEETGEMNNRRTFYRLITPQGEVTIYSGYVDEPEEVQKFLDGI